MNLCVDIGNTAIKTAVFSGPSLIGKNQWTNLDNNEIRLLATNYPRIKYVIVCSVKPENMILAEKFKKQFGHLLVFDENTSIPFTSMYETGNTLGKDRLAAIAGANNNYPGRSVLVIDAGTAITYDMVDEFNRYLGGNISPGLSMRFRALHNFTGKLPLVEPKPEVPFLARSTVDAIAAGVQNGIVFEMESYISRCQEQFRDLIIIFTGGDAKHFDKKLKSTIFADPDLVLTGLNRILTYNVENN